MQLIAHSIEEMSDVAQTFLKEIGDKRVIAFFGNMGVGKTTFIKEVCKQLGVTDVVNSPTFAVINEYASNVGPIYHFDFYRIKNIEEAYDFGYEDYFYSGNFCFIEWSEKIVDILPDDCVQVTITELENGNRKFVIE